MLEALLLFLWLPAVAGCAYLLLLTVMSGRLPPAAVCRVFPRFAVIVPAHDEAAVIGRTLASLQRLDWPPARLRIIVVADNCTDETAALARAAGAEVIERRDPFRRGKGYALQRAFSHCLDQDWADALVVIDADSEVSPNLLQGIAARLQEGADVVQVHYGVLNPQASWRTRLMTLAQSCFHRVRSRARERLHLSCGLRGNGWCVTPRLLAQIPYAAFSLAEDVEYGITLGLNNWRVHYADECEVRGEMVSGADAARSQRRRWEGGRSQLLRSQTRTLLLTALQHRSALCLDLALDLLLPPLSSLAGYVLVMTVITGLSGTHPGPALFCWLCLVAHVGRGWQLSGLRADGLTALLRVPAFLLWKLFLALGASVDRAWIRTQREQRP